MKRACCPWGLPDILEPCCWMSVLAKRGGGLRNNSCLSAPRARIQAGTKKNAKEMKPQGDNDKGGRRTFLTEGKREAGVAGTIRGSATSRRQTLNNRRKRQTDGTKVWRGGHNIRGKRGLIWQDRTSCWEKEGGIGKENEP